MSIEILPQEVINQIAAGEVVERPSHLVKELVENSLDAQATYVHIEIHRGGQFIRVMDDGTGIKKQELKLALQRHATSKIRETNDLWNLNSFGFRGEALASAAAVSELTLQSRHHQQKESFQIKSLFGKVSDEMSSSREVGTEINIDNLFENVPARLKFLKSDAAEYAHIKNTIKAMALMHPEVEFKLSQNGQLDLLFKRADAMTRVKQILSVDEVFLEEKNMGSFTIKAYYVSPHTVQKTSKNIWLFAQKRWIQDRALQTAVMDAYRSLLMHGEYPFVVIDLVCDPAVIDVNIHPTKSQVKFQNASDAFRAVQSTVRAGLEKAPWNKSYHQFTSNEIAMPNASRGVADLNRSYSTEAQATSLFQDSPALSATSQFEQKSLIDDQQTLFKKKHFDLTSSPMEKYNSSRLFENKNRSDEYRPRIEDLANLNPGYWSTFQVIGQIHLTYIVCQKDEKMILVDQHAAHERVAFEKLMRVWKGGAIERQDYLFPLAIDLSPEKVEAVLSLQNDIERMGLVIESLGPQVIGVKSAPAFIKEAALPRLFDKLAHDLVEYGGSYSLEKSIADLFATMACHSVVRAGQSLSYEEMVELLKAMDEFPLSSFCPHGRPVSIEFKFSEIEKMFGRTL